MDLLLGAFWPLAGTESTWKGPSSCLVHLFHDRPQISPARCHRRFILQQTVLGLEDILWVSNYVKEIQLCLNCPIILTRSWAGGLPTWRDSGRQYRRLQVLSYSTWVRGPGFLSLVLFVSLCV